MKTVNGIGSTYELSGTTGKVLSAGKNMETKVSGSGGGGFTYRGTGGNSNVRITSQTIVHDHLILEGQNGQEHSYQLKDFNVSCREGNTLTVVFVGKPGKSTGYNVAVINHNTRDIFFSKANLSAAASPNKWLYIGVFLLVAFLGFKSQGTDFFVAGFIIAVVIFAIFTALTITNSSKIKEAIKREDFSNEAIPLRTV